MEGRAAMETKMDMDDRGYRKAVMTAHTQIIELEKSLRPWLGWDGLSGAERDHLDDQIFNLRVAAEALVDNPRFRAKLIEDLDDQPTAPADAGAVGYSGQPDLNNGSSPMPTKPVSQWTRGNVIAYFEKAALEASLVNASEFDDRDLYDVDGGLQAEGPINAKIQPPLRSLSDAQDALFRELIIFIYQETVGGRPPGEVSNMIASGALVGLCQQVIRGVIALPHDRRKELAETAVRKLVDEGRTACSKGEAPQSEEHLINFAVAVADAITRHTDRRLAVLPEER